MATIVRSATKVRQGNLTLYATSLTVRHLCMPGMYRIDRLDPMANTNGFQRLLEHRRAKRLSEYLSDGLGDGDAFLPTSLFLATEKDIAFDHSTNSIAFEIDKVGPFDVVDGQHRIAGLLLAAEKDRRFLDFEIPVNIAVSLDVISQMCHFLIVNTTQRSVDRSVAQQIVARLTKMVDVAKLPTIPRWIRRQVDRGEDARALDMVTYLNTEESSVWFGKIRMANDARKDKSVTIHQKTFVESIKRYILVSAHPLSAIGIDIHKQQRALTNYWNAICDLLCDFDSAQESVVMKGNGVHFFHLVSQTAFHQAAGRKDFTQSSFRMIFERAFRALPVEDFRLGTIDYWLAGGEASGLNQGALRRLAASMNRAMNAVKYGFEARL